MLKAQLIRPRIAITGESVKPRLLSADYHWLDVAQGLIQLFRQNVGSSRGGLQDRLREYEGESLDYPIMRGMADILFKRAIFDNQPAVDPVEVRQLLFQNGPITAKTDLLQPKSRTQLIHEAATTFAVTAEQIESALFADLLEEQILQGVGEPITPKGLIERYNLEVARGLLYWAKEVVITVEDSYRDVFRYIKLAGLMYTIKQNGKGYTITLHGPLSPFVSSTVRYGMQFARFMPALLLCAKWQMVAQVRPPTSKRFLRYELDDGTSLRGYFKASAEFASKLEATFSAEFEQKYNRADRVWELAYEDELIPIGDGVMIPDFSFTNRKDGRRALLEIVGFWHPNYLRRKLSQIKHAQRTDLIILVYERVKIADGAFEAATAGELLYFKRKPVLKDVLAAVERCAQ